MKKIEEIFKKICTREVILYIFFGVLTTLVNLGSFYILNEMLKWNENLSNFVAIILAVLFAYITNKDLVFHSEAKKIKEKLYEFFKFILGRSFTMLLEFFGGLILFNFTIPKFITKAVLTVLVIILNFFISKFFAFKTNNDGSNKNNI